MGESDKTLEKEVLFNESLNKAQAEMTHAIADKNNPFYNSVYADLASGWNAIRAPFTKHGFSITQPVFMDDQNRVFVLTELRHNAGHKEVSKYPILLSQVAIQDPQKLKSAITYARRASLFAMAGISEVDDDANIASGKDESKKQVKSDYKKDLPPRMSIVQRDAIAKKGTNNLVGPLLKLQEVVKRKNIKPEFVKKAINVIYEKESSHHLNEDELNDMATLLENDTEHVESVLKEIERQRSMDGK